MLTILKRDSMGVCFFSAGYDFYRGDRGKINIQFVVLIEEYFISSLTRVTKAA